MLYKQNVHLSDITLYNVTYTGLEAHNLYHLYLKKGETF